MVVTLPALPDRVCASTSGRYTLVASPLGVLTTPTTLTSVPVMVIVSPTVRSFSLA